MSRLSEDFGATAVADLLSALLLIRGRLEDGDIRTDSGLCWMLETRLHDEALGLARKNAAKKLCGHLYTEWPEYSGCPVYPVPGGGDASEDEIVALDAGHLDFDDSVKVAECYFESAGQGNLNGGDFWAGAYGAKRRQLLAFLIDELTKEAVQ